MPEESAHERLKKLLDAQHQDSDQRRAPEGFHRYSIFVMALPISEKQRMFEELNALHDTALTRHTREEKDRMSYHGDWYGMSDIYIPIHTIDWLNEEESAGMLSVLQRYHDRLKEIETRNGQLNEAIHPQRWIWTTRVMPADDLLHYELMITRKKPRWLQREREDPATALNRLFGEPLFAFRSQAETVGHLSIAERDIPKVIERLREDKLRLGVRQTLLSYCGLASGEGKGDPSRRDGR